MTARDGVTAPLVFGTVGTDFHRFDRLVDWLERWAHARTGLPARCLIQYGSSRPPHAAEGMAYLPHEQMAATLRNASAVVCHGGPATIIEARAAGIRPIVVPRRAELGEHVDDHQVAFCRRLHEAGDVALADSEEQLRDLLDDALANAERWRTADGTGRREAVQEFSLLVTDLLQPRTRGRTFLRRQGGRR